MIAYYPAICLVSYFAIRVARYYVSWLAHYLVISLSY